MEEKKLTDNEIVEAYFHKCKEQSCENCPLGDIENCMTYVEDLIKRLQSKTEWLKKERDDMHNDVIQAEEYAESLKKANMRILFVNEQVIKQNEKLKQQVESQRKIIEYHDSLQDEVAMLKEERENMQAEIIRFEDMKFTQEHCDLYQENEWLKASLQKSVKDTAKEILQAVLEDVGEFCAGDIVEELAKRYGVEVE